MPCEIPEYQRAAISRNALNAATRAGCDMRTILRRHHLEEELTAETRKWIAEHDEVDRQRIDREILEGTRNHAKQQALAKLNMDERRILGL